MCLEGLNEACADLNRSMGTIMSMMLLFTWSSGICRVKLGSHHFRKSPFWSVYTETQPQHIQTSLYSRAENTGVV